MVVQKIRLSGSRLKNERRLAATHKGALSVRVQLLGTVDVDKMAGDDARRDDVARVRLEFTVVDVFGYEVSDLRRHTVLRAKLASSRTRERSDTYIEY